LGHTLKVAPSILAADFANLETEIKKITAAGADWVHVDVMDGHFVKNITIGVPVVASVKKVCTLPLDVHLMIEYPENYVDAFLKAGSDIVTVHVESSNKIPAIFEKIKKAGARTGLSLRPGTSLSKLLPYLPQCDVVLVMTVEPGFGGQSFMEDQVAKITELKKLRKENNWTYLIEVDGGVNEKTIQYCKDADVVVAGSYVFQGNYQTQIETLKK
jgi:ribulose-phosphate 3-epimerase